MPIYNTIIVDDVDQVRKITLHREKQKNAFNLAMITELTHAFSSISHQKVCVLDASGRDFCAGADLQWMQQSITLDHESNQKDATTMSNMFETIYKTPIPTIALTQGLVFGGGVGIAACCDIVIGIRNTKFTLSEVKLGLIPAVISPYVIQAIGSRQALRYFLSAETIDADTAKEIGLLHEVFQDLASAQKFTNHLSEKITTNQPQAVKAAKSLVQNVSTQSIDDSKQYCLQKIAEIRQGEEAQHTIRRFFDKKIATKK